MPTLETMRKTGTAKIEDAIKALKDAIKAVDKIDEAIDAVDHSNGANWRKTAAGMQRCIEALESKPAAELVKETCGADDQGHACPSSAVAWPLGLDEAEIIEAGWGKDA